MSRVSDPRMRAVLRDIREAQTWEDVDEARRTAYEEIARREALIRAFYEAVRNQEAMTSDRLRREAGPRSRGVDA